MDDDCMGYLACRIEDLLTDPSSSMAPALGNNLMTDQEKKEKERFLMFTRVLMK